MSRDPNRIKTILRALERYWNETPDMRLGQIIANVARDVEVDPFYLEDEDLLKLILRGE